MENLTHEPSLLGTVHDLAVVLGVEPDRFTHDATVLRDRVTLTNAEARRLLAIATRDPLIAAYNAVFDFKDTQIRGGADDYAAYEALQALEKAMDLFGSPKPTRFDNKA